LTRTSILERPFVRFGREVAGDPAAALRREWLVTNGLGGYASGSLMVPATRRYHGLLVAALAPPVERTVVVQGSLEWLVAGTGAGRIPLSSLEDHMRDAGLGTHCEILEGDPPHEPRGCIAQAWGVAEVLRAWRLVGAAARAANEVPR
jgi:glycogen debranching enzyme